MTRRKPVTGQSTRYIHDRLKRPGIPHISLATFEQREAVLKGEGFIWWERFWLCQHRISGPAIELVRAERLELLKAFKQEVYDTGLDNIQATNEWRKRVTFLYRRNGWLFNDGSFNPFRMVDKAQGQGGDVTPQPKMKKRPDMDKSKKTVREFRTRSPKKIFGQGRFNTVL